MSLQPPKPHLNASIQKDPPVFRPSFWPQNPEIRKPGTFYPKNQKIRPNDHKPSIAGFRAPFFALFSPQILAPKTANFRP
jgi:hypothetical protein